VLAEIYDIITIGRAGIDLYSLDFYMPLEEVTRFARYVGGSAANVAVGAARLGLRSAIITRVSDDELGEYIIRQLSRMGVDTRYIKKDPEGKTGIVFAEIIPGRDGRFIFYREKASDLLLRVEDIDPEVVARTRSIVITGTGLSSEPSRGANYHAMELARKHGAWIVLNLDWRPTLWRNVTESERLRYYARAIEMADIVIGNRGEYVAATGGESVEKAMEYIRSINRRAIIVVTQGGEGAMVITDKGDIIRASPYSVGYLKGLGAGDGFIAGFMYGYLKGWDLYRSLRLGNAVGAIVVTRHSCSEAMPTLDEVMSFIETRGGF
jgi:5-dehydro-2-deoxygluconokinase